MSNKSPVPVYTSDKADYSREAFYSLLNDTATGCNSICGNGNQTCYKNCVIKNKALIETMRDYIIYNNHSERNFR